ncbi:Ger(x)C family spore germination protein [Tuberibacillus sp. Marseille-P3662]|uniref:Ger(x)C family spore germination protein n=1 Tax=Tuberibacillus sp. Marseille-P3662 TaxID=1965358 RepID=UPI000A1C8961|nr:Ger(x)C family spore germination protein [Tuberibacillus sp. Marseille-P3662]
MKLARILLISIMMLGLTGCWSRVEVNDIAIVTAVGLDEMENGNIRLTLEVAIPNQLVPTGKGGGQGPTTFTASEKGATVMAAYRKLQEKLPRKVFFSHSRIILIGEKLAQEGVSKVLDFFTRYPESRLNDYIMVAKGKAADLLEIQTKLERVPSEEMRELTKREILVEVNLRDFTNMLLGTGIEPVAPQFKIKPLEVQDESSFSAGGSQSSSEKYMSISGSGVFYRDQLVGWMDDIETRGVLWFHDKVKDGVITLKVPQKKGGGKVSTNIVRAKTEIQPKLNQDHLKIVVQVYAETALYENDSKLNLKQPKAIRSLTMMLEKQIQNRMDLALDKAQQQFKSDIFGFGRAVYRKYPGKWRNDYKERWDQVFPKLEVKIVPNVVLERTGLTSESLSGGK